MDPVGNTSIDQEQSQIENYCGDRFVTFEDQSNKMQDGTRRMDRERKLTCVVAVNVGNGMDVCFVPEHITGLQRAPLEAELEDVQALKR